MKKRLLSMLLVLVMVAGFVPVTALADGEPSVVGQGTCGATEADNLTWTLTQDGVLTISGAGAMKDFSDIAGLAPWIEFDVQIISVVIEEGVTHIGDSAFSSMMGGQRTNLADLADVTIADTVRTIGLSAFVNTKLSELTLPEGVVSIGNNSFSQCFSLKTLNLPKSLNVPYNAFYRCPLETVNYGGSEADWLNFRISLGKEDKPAFQNAQINILGPSITAVEISGYRTEYCLHEQLDFTTAVVTATLSDSEKAEIPTSDIEVFSFDNETAGVKTAVVGYKDCRTELTVTVTDETAIANGSCGTEQSWTLKSSGTLMIRGTGAMPAFDANTNRPSWEEYREQITSVVIEEGITAVGDFTFYRNNTVTYGNITSVTLPDTITTIGKSAFRNTGIEELHLPENLTTLGVLVFDNCKSLDEIYIPAGLTTSGTALRNCQPNTINYGGTQAQWEAFVATHREDIQSILNAAKVNFLSTEPVAVSIAVSGTYKTEYGIGDEFDATGIVVTATMSEGEPQDVTGSVTFTGFDSETAGEKTITVTYGELTTSFIVTVMEKSPVNTVEELIDAIGEVTLEKEAAIIAARTAYDALSETEQAQVTNYAVLTAAEAALAALHQAEIDQAAADAVIALINALPTDVALTDEAAITEARAAYNALTDAQKALVTNLDALTAAETALQTLQDQAAAGAVSDAISALPAADAITLDDEAAVAAARAAYDALTPAQQALVDDSALVAAENAINQLKAEAVTNLIAALPAADAVTLENEADIAAARAAYDALTDAQKALVDASALVAAEARIAELKFGTVKPVVKAENDKKTGKIQLTITPVAGAVKYHILVSDKADGTYTEAATVTGTTYTYEGTPGTQYFFKVVAESTAGVLSAESAVVSLFRLPAQVTSLKVKSKKKKEVTLTWKKVSGAKKYVIYMSKNGKTGWKKIGTVKTNKFTYKKAPAGKKMYFRVQALTANGKKGEFSKVVSVKVKK
jgi:hypothetical protein